MSTDEQLAQSVELNTQEQQTEQQTEETPPGDTQEIQILAHDHDGDGYPEHYVLKMQELDTTQQPQKCCTDDIVNRSARYLFTTMVPVLGVLLCFGNSDLNQILGISILCMYAFYFCTIAYYFFSARRSEGSYLFRVYTAARRVNLPMKSRATQQETGWTKLNVASHQQLYPLKPIHSISEFSAIDGAVPSMMLANLGMYTWSVVTLHFMMNIKFRAKYFWGFADTFSMIGASGLVLLGVFEADPFNKYMNKLHMFGALLGSGTLIGFLIQQSSWDDKHDGGNVIASFLVFFFVVGFTMWSFNLKYCDKREAQKFKPLSGCEKLGLWVRPCGFCAEVETAPMIPLQDITREQKNEITHLSLLNVVFEALVLMCGATALSLFIFYYNVVQNSYDYSDYDENPYYQDNGFYGSEGDYYGSYGYTPAPDYYGLTPAPDYFSSTSTTWTP